MNKKPGNRSLSMALITPGPLGAAARTFIDKHTELDLEISPLDECPICLEAYTSTTEQSIRIRGIAGCSHVLGLNCLKRILGSNAQQGMKCPLCRTQWLAPTSRESRMSAMIRALEQSRNHLQAGHLQVNPEVERQTQSTAASLRPSLTGDVSTTTPASTPNSRFTSPHALAEAPGDEAFDAQLNDYNDFRRDVRNIRTRASSRPSPRRSFRLLNTSSRMSNNLRENDQPSRINTAMVRSNPYRSRSLWGLGRTEPSEHNPEEMQGRSQSHKRTSSRVVAPPAPEPATSLTSSGHSPSLHSREKPSTTPASNKHTILRASEDEHTTKTHSSNSPGNTAAHSQPAHDQPQTELHQNLSAIRGDMTSASRPHHFKKPRSITDRLSSASSQGPSTSTNAFRTSRSRSPHSRSLDQEGERRNSPGHLRFRSFSAENHDQPIRFHERPAAVHKHERHLDAQSRLFPSNEAVLGAREQAVHSRRIDATSREQILTAREREVLSREEQVAEREKSVLAREEHMNMQQQREMMARQQNEVARIVGEVGSLP
ncbi:hypothetical protein M3J07_004936 [Ascochyta lentis]